MKKLNVTATRGDSHNTYNVRGCGFHQNNVLAGSGANAVEQVVEYGSLRDAVLQGGSINLYGNYHSCLFSGIDFRRKVVQGVFVNCNMKDCTWDDTTTWGSPLNVLRGFDWWTPLPQELIQDMMHFDAVNSPDPKKFNKWANYGPCPFGNSRWSRALSFSESRDLWRPELLDRPAPTALDLAIRLLKATNKYVPTPKKKTRKA